MNRKIVAATKTEAMHDNKSAAAISHKAIMAQYQRDTVLFGCSTREIKTYKILAKKRNNSS